jgi:AraC family transcriptional regulator, regulatory protein of adaptative response / methylated-DNA-[protein]-cysteine methyltransferase
VLRRDYRYDNSFVFGVRSTKIYCRPSCPARQPHRDHVVFYQAAHLAEEAGFRACKRCKPNDSSFITLRRRRIEQTCAYIQQNLDEKFGLSELGKHVGLNSFHLQRLFKRIVGITPREYAEAVRLKRAKISLRSGQSVRKAIYKSGRNSTSWLYTDSFRKLGMHPSAYKNNGRGTRIWYSISDCRLGKLLVGATEKGICAVSMGDSNKMVEAFLMSEYPSAQIQREDTNQLSTWVNQILEYVDGDSVVPLQDLPLDIQATSFQYRVWKELQSIPYAETASYSDIARKVSSPDGSRAVANACASNPVSLVIPCHRVIRKNGNLGGYGWGFERKESILRHERESLEKKKAEA